jgi:hypothetical protein
MAGSILIETRIVNKKTYSSVNGCACSSSPMNVETIDYKLAQRFFERYEHLGNCGLGVWHYGAFVDSNLVGVVSFGTPCFASNRGALCSIASSFGLSIFQISRGGTLDGSPLNTPSRVLSAALARFHGDRGNCIIVAYADRSFNEVGTIYQACNAMYTGETNPKDQANYVINGQYMSGWLVRKKFGTRSMQRLKQIDENLVKIPLSNKYRYIFVLAPRRLKRRIARTLRPFVRSYPTRDSERIPPMDIASLVTHH